MKRRERRSKKRLKKVDHIYVPASWILHQLILPEMRWRETKE